jgi:hypothetical protein
MPGARNGFVNGQSENGPNREENNMAAGEPGEEGREELWAALRMLRPSIEALAAGVFSGEEREKEVVKILARVISLELQFREKQRPASE